MKRSRIAFRVNQPVVSNKSYHSYYPIRHWILQIAVQRNNNSYWLRTILTFLADRLSARIAATLSDKPTPISAGTDTSLRTSPARRRPIAVQSERTNDELWLVLISCRLQQQTDRCSALHCGQCSSSCCQIFVRSSPYRVSELLWLAETPVCNIKEAR